MPGLTKGTCKPCEGGVLPMNNDQVNHLLKEIPNWQTDQETGVRYIQRLFEFKDYYHTIGFVNFIAWISHCENHHPELEISYNRCIVRYSTHAILGLSENDFICAAKVDAGLT